MKRVAGWRIVLLAACAVVAVACRRTATAPETARTPADELREQLNPVHQATVARTTAFTAPPPPNPATVFPVPIRPFLPPGITSDQPRFLSGDRRVATSAPVASSEIPPLAVTQPDSIRLPAAPLAQATAPDPAQINVWITSSPASEVRGLPPKWDRPQLATDPTDERSHAIALALPGALRESAVPFLRIAIPDPFEQITIAELRNPPPDNDPPVSTFSRPAVTLIESAPAGK